MPMLFHREISPSPNVHVARLLDTVAQFQSALDDVAYDIQNQYAALITKGYDWRELRNEQMKIKVTEKQFHELEKSLLNIVPVLGIGVIDYGEKFVIGEFNDTILDILIHSIGDNHRLSDDPFIRNLNILWERHILCPVISHIVSTGDSEILANEPLIDGAKVMETWTRFDGDPTNARGMFQTIGSLLSKGFFKALEPACYTPYLPSSFVGNLVGWGLHATEPEDRNDIYKLLTIINSLHYYAPSCGVVEKVLSYIPGKVTRPVIDIIVDTSISKQSDLRDINIPNDIEWQTALLSLAQNVVLSRDQLPSGKMQ